MDRSDTLKLVSVSYQPDAIGQLVPVETERTVYCSLSSINRSEWATAGQLGLKPEIVATMFAPDYEGEEIAVLGSVRYGIYRTYIRQDEQIELYLERKVGVTNGQ